MTLENLRIQIEKRLQNVVSEKMPENLYAPTTYLLKAGGKRIRPLLTVLSCLSVGGKFQSCRDAAIAVELLHTFTLVHDDIMDHDDLRRGIPAVHIKWDEPTAILAGDGLVTLAFRTLLETRHQNTVLSLKIFADGLLALCEGQAMDKTFESRKNVTLPDYLKMIEKKTAKLIEVACEVGAVLGDAKPEQRRALKHFAKKLGTAFQIQDDLLDVSADPSVLGKPAASDIVEKKKTYLTIHFIQNATAHQRKQFAGLDGKKKLSKPEIRLLRTLFETTGTLASARGTVNCLIREAVSSLHFLPDSPSRRALTHLALSLIERSY